ncbi:MAG TPA: DUF4126 domain-containing protein [Verrucomicrobiae bacterium]|nr:DUF4126 domain-containing protein [Verrucomicrobiae bacterium]
MFADFIIPAIPTGTQLTALLVVICFSAGLNVYATVAMLGLLARGHFLILPDSLHALVNWYVIGICAALFAVEFIGDKIPVFDLFWNAMHTFVRVPAAALLTYAATAQLPEWERLAATFVGASIALAAHAGKVAARTAVTGSPEPFSNMALSMGEDLLVVFLTWFATRHVYAAAAIALAGLAIIVVAIRAVIRAMMYLFRDTEHTVARSPKSAAMD